MQALCPEEDSWLAPLRETGAEEFFVCVIHCPQDDEFGLTKQSWGAPQIGASQMRLIDLLLPCFFVLHSGSQFFRASAFRARAIGMDEPSCPKRIACKQSVPGERCYAQGCVLYGWAIRHARPGTPRHARSRLGHRERRGAGLERLRTEDRRRTDPCSSVSLEGPDTNCHDAPTSSLPTHAAGEVGERLPRDCVLFMEIVGGLPRSHLSCAFAVLFDSSSDRKSRACNRRMAQAPKVPSSQSPKTPVRSPEATRSLVLIWCALLRLGQRWAHAARTSGLRCAEHMHIKGAVGPRD